MIPQWSDIHSAKGGRFFIIVAASELQKKYFRVVALFIKRDVVAKSFKAFEIMRKQFEKAAMQQIAKIQVAWRRTRYELLLMTLEDDVPAPKLVSHQRADALFRGFHGPPREMQGEL